MEREENGYSKVEITGKFSGEIEEYINSADYKVFRTYLNCKRLSGVVDSFEINMKEHTANIANKLVGKHVKIEGDLRTYKVDSGCNRTVIFAHDIYEVEETLNEENVAYIKGNRLDTRKTRNKHGIAVCESKVDIRSKYGKASRVSVVAWGHLADVLNKAENGTPMTLKGRLQYRKLASYDGRTDIGRIEIAVYEIDDEQEE